LSWVRGFDEIGTLFADLERIEFGKVKMGSSMNDGKWVNERGVKAALDLLKMGRSEAGEAAFKWLVGCLAYGLP
jgi:hypothetical protein